MVASVPCQGEWQWVAAPQTSDFPVATSAYCTVPTYPSGPMGFMLCSKNLSTNFRKLTQLPTRKQVEPMQRKYYNSHVPREAPFCLSVPPPP